jgi:hypothetical protein
MPISPFQRVAVIGIAAVLFATSARSHAAPSPCKSAAQNIPRRPANAPGASAFLDSVAAMSEPERDHAIRGELMAGNLPEFLRAVQPVQVTGRMAHGAAVHLTLCVMADYLSVGSDGDFVLTPMGLTSALSVAAQLGFTLPTRRMVDLIYGQSVVHMAPQPLAASDQMRSTAYYRRHNALVQAQRAVLGALPDVLTAGHMKDLVLTPRLWGQPGRVAIYGWHRGVGAPIQPLSTVHGARYADYSHGIRLVSTVVFVNDMPKSIFDVLADPQLAPLLSDEGPMPSLPEWLDRTIATESGT